MFSAMPAESECRTVDGEAPGLRHVTWTEEHLQYSLASQEATQDGRGQQRT